MLSLHIKLIDAYGIKLNPSGICKSWPIAVALLSTFSTIAYLFLSFWKVYDTDMVASYHIVPFMQCYCASVITSNAVHDYWKCYINIVNMDVLGVLLIYPHSPSTLDIVRTYQPNPSQPCNTIILLMYIRAYVHIRIHVYISYCIKYSYKSISQNNTKLQ